MVYRVLKERDIRLDPIIHSRCLKFGIKIHHMESVEPGSLMAWKFAASLFTLRRPDSLLNSVENVVIEGTGCNSHCTQSIMKAAVEGGHGTLL